MKNELRVTTQGIRGGKNNHQTVGYAQLSVRENGSTGREVCTVFIDTFTGHGATYQEREKALINISFDQGSTWSGTAEELQQKLTPIK